jgi:hypothetical protein
MEARRMGVDDVLDDVPDNGFDVQDLGIVAAYLCTEDEAEEEKKRLERPENGMLDPADIGLEIGLIDDEELENTEQSPHPEYKMS